MTRLVTGGAGFVGSHLCDSLLNSGKQVICLDNIGSGQYRNIEHHLDKKEFEFINGDVRDDIGKSLSTESVNPDSIDRIYHLASRASPKDFRSHPIEIATTNSQGAYNIFSFANDVDARVLFASTSEIYGDPEVHPQPEWYAGNVDPRGPRSSYQEGKRLGESLAVSFYKEHGLDVRTARLFNTYGPRMRPNDGRVVPTFMFQAVEGRNLTVYGDGTQTRSLLYIADQIHGLRRLMDATGFAGDVVNIGSTAEITINELAKIIIQLTGTSSRITYEPLPENEPPRRRPDISKAMRKLGWKPTIDLDYGLDQTLLYFENQTR